MPTKRRPAKAKGITAKTRASDDALRAALRDADLKKFDRVLAKAIKPARR